MVQRTSLTTTMSGQTLEEALEQRILDKLEAKFRELESDTKKPIFRVGKDNKIKRLASEKSVEWRCFKSGALATDTPSEGDPSIIQLSQDVYSILSTASLGSVPFWISILIIFGFQFSLLILLLANQVHINSENPFNLPANVETPVRISQVLLIIIALFSQDDLLAGIETLVDGFPASFRGNRRFVSMGRFQWGLSSIIRLSQGLVNLLAAFVLSIQSETVPDVLLNVLGVGFVSNLDDLAFRLGMKGYFGGSMKRMTEDLCDVQFHRPNNNQNARSALATVKDFAHTIFAFAVLLAGIAAFTIFAVQQDIGIYSEQHIRIEFGDEVLPFLGLFNGCYQASDSSKNIGGRLVYEQVGYPNGGKFGFCSDFGDGDSGWAFFIGEHRDDVCKHHIVRSSETSTFSLVEAGMTNWYTSDDIPLDSLEITEIKTPTSECGQSMFKLSNSSCPLLLAFDTMTMSRLDMNVDIDSGRSLDASISHPIYRNNEGNDESFTLIFFAGRRWIQTSSASDSLRLLLGNESSVFSNIQDFFVNDGLYSLIDSMRTFADDKSPQWVSAVSESVDTASDQGSPLGLQWYFPRYLDVVNGTSEAENLQRNFPTADLARPIDSSLACLYCNSESNPCLYDGVCDNDLGQCNCIDGTSGKLCQILPLGNGICNVRFNTAAYNYDEGDCCGGTCFGDRCGEDDLLNPFSDSDLGLNYFSNKDEEWLKTFRGRDFAFGVDLSEVLLYIDYPPLRYSHCKDPRTALLTIQNQFSIPPSWVVPTATVRCDGTLYLRTPYFVVESNRTTFAERVRVPYGAVCEVSIEVDVNGGSDDSFTVSLFAENQSVPFLQRFPREGQDYDSLVAFQVPIRLRIPDSECVWNTFVENRVNIFTDENIPWSMSWNGYLLEDEFQNLTKGILLDSICNRDPQELMERYALWQISKSSPVDQSENFVGHICDSQWYSMSVNCCGRRVCSLFLEEWNPYLPSDIGLFASLTSLALPGIALTQLPSEIGRLTSLTTLSLSNNQLKSLPFEIGKLTSLSSLDFAGNLFTSFPPEIGRLTLLSELWLGDNQLTSLTSEIGRLTTLATLSLNNNQLVSLPVDIGSLTSLSHFEVRDNRLTSLPSEIGRLASLNSLRMNGNQLTSLPSEIGRLTSLSFLDMNGNQLTSLPSEIESLTALTEFYLFDNQLASLPSEIEQLTSLSHLEVWDNRLTSLPSEIGRLASLNSLDMNGNQLTSLPSEIGRLTSLNSLDMNGNQLTSLPSEFGRLTSLSDLRLRGNRLTSIPSEIASLTSLWSLQLQQNQLTSLPSEIGNWGSIWYLELQRNQLTSLPSEIGQLTSLFELMLYENQLTQLPSEIGQLTSLAKFVLYENQLTQLPSEIGQLTSLTRLEMDAHQLQSIPSNLTSLQSLTLIGNLTSLPPEIEKLTSLTSLSLSDNRLTSLPSEIGRLTYLNSLSLNDNQLTELPSDIGRLTSLEQLYLSGNQLTSIPSEIAGLTSLWELELQRNQLTSLPTEIGDLTAIVYLYLHRNQLTSLPSEIGNSSSLYRLNLFFNSLTLNSLPAEILNMPSLESLLVCGDDGGYGCGTSDSGDSSCSDDVGWRNWDGDGCEIFEAYGYDECSSGGNEHGISSNENEACCICGGGTPTNQGE